MNQDRRENEQREIASEQQFDNSTVQSDELFITGREPELGQKHRHDQQCSGDTPVTA
jgi:hypothetical protein